MVLSIKRISIDDARVLLKGAAMKSSEIEVPMCTAICDESGLLLAFEREDGAKASSISIAVDKAFTAGAARRSTRFYSERTIPEGPTWGIHVSNQGHFSIIPGGLPVIIDGTVVGGIGCSAGTADEDEIVAQAALDYFFSTSVDGQG